VVYRLIRQLPELLFPPRCRLCGDPAGARQQLCAACHAELPWLGTQCRQCALPLAGTDGDMLCGRCQRRPPAFDRTCAALHYVAPVDFLVKRLKFGHELALARLLAALFLPPGAATGPLPQALVPVPLHPARLRSRGFNQATELARLLGRRHALPVQHLCRRLRNTAPQSALSVSARRLNLHNAFALTRVPDCTHVALIDDVMTSGQTAHELARVLKHGGVETVEVWVIARAGQA